MLIFALSLNNNVHSSLNKGNSELDMEILDENNLKYLKRSDTYIESLIHIDGTIQNNWTWTVGNYSWCNGAGSQSDPYIIENVSIDAGSAMSGIMIENSKNVYFIIRNCNVSNVSGGNYGTGWDARAPRRRRG